MNVLGSGQWSRRGFTRAAFAGVASFCLLAQATSLYSGLDRLMLDCQFRFLRRAFPRTLAGDVVVVGIDEEATDQLPEALVMWHPYLGRFFSAMAVARPSVVGLDLILPSRSISSLLIDHEKALLEGFLAARTVVPVVLAQTITEGRRLKPILPTLASLAGPQALALILVAPDPDGTVRHFSREVDFQHGQRPTLAAAMAQRIGAAADSGLIDFAAGPAMTYVPFLQVLEWQEGGDEAALRAAFQNRPVLLGTVLPFEDRHEIPTPLLTSEPARRAVPGVFVHAQALRSLLAGGMIHEVPTSLLLAATFIATLPWWWASRLFVGGALLAVAAAVTAAITTAALYHGVFVPTAGLLVSACIAFCGRTTLEIFYAIREKRRLRESFAPYVSPDVLTEILAGRIKPELGGTRRPVCLLFSDIRGFTQRSEAQAPEAIISLLNRYLTRMTAVIHEHGGTLDKFMGDGIMAFFGAPSPSPTAVVDAFTAGRSMLSRLQDLNQELAVDGIEPIDIGIALHYGEVVVGHIGSVARHEYTTIGDPVNIAARLESLSRELGYPIICSREVADRLTDREGFVDLGMHNLKGHSPVEVFGWTPAARRTR